MLQYLNSHQVLAFSVGIYFEGMVWGIHDDVRVLGASGFSAIMLGGLDVWLFASCGDELKGMRSFGTQKS